MVPRRRFQAPRGDRDVLAVPDFSALPDLVEQNRRQLDRSDVQIGGLALRDLRKLARQEALREAVKYLTSFGPAFSPENRELSADVPLVLAGHQPELSHPGVWVKNFALNGLARKVGGIPFNLVVDNDTIKSTSLRFPTWHGDPLGAHLQSVPFDDFAAEVPYEERGVSNPRMFESFADRAASLWRHWNVTPLLVSAWEKVVACPSKTIGEKFAAVRRSYEQEWGAANLELPVSWLAKTDAFAKFAGHLLCDLTRFRTVYNHAVQQYRERHGIDSASHPVPDLAPDEAPFWGQTGSDGRRGRVTNASQVDPGSLRPRALTLTLFARVCLGDFFVHGIGGGKYDEVTDAIIRDYFGLEPPAYQVLSATLHLPLPRLPSSESDVKVQQRFVRDLYWNPQRHVTAENRSRVEVKALLAEKTARISQEPPASEHAARRVWYRELQQINERLRPFVSEQIPPAQSSLERKRREAAANAVFERRDFSWVLYPEELLREFCRQFLAL